MIIREQDKNNILKIANATLQQPAKILAFGSRVNGDAHDTSDLDLVVVTDTKEKVQIDNLLDFKEQLRESNIPIIVQVLDWHRIPPSFHKNILQKYEEFGVIKSDLTHQKIP